MTDAQEQQERMRKAGQNMQSLGCLLTLLITVPILLTLVLGPLGLVLGIGVIVLVLLGRRKAARQEDAE